MTPLRIALYQGPCGVPGNPADRLAALDRAAARSAAAGAELLVTPELFLTGYAVGDAVATLAQRADGPASRTVARTAVQHRIAIAHGYPERSGRAVYNAVRLTGPDGRALADYRKTHLYGTFEKSCFSPGGEPVVQAELAGLRLGLLICYDVEFPEAVRAHALAGTELLLVPTALMHPYEFVAQSLVPVRAWENQLYIAYTNRCGREGEFTFTGLSALAAPDGTVPARAGSGAQLLFADVDPALPAALRSEDSRLQDRRPELYRSLG